MPKLRLPNPKNLFVYFPIVKFVVHEHSMSPTLQPGDQVLALRFLHGRRGDVVVFRHNRMHMIKRVDRVQNGRYYLLGDNPRGSIDSRRFGAVHKKDIVGVVFSKKPKSR